MHFRSVESEARRLFVVVLQLMVSLLTAQGLWIMGYGLWLWVFLIGLFEV